MIENYFIIFNGSYGRKVYCVDERNKDKIIASWSSSSDESMNFFFLLLPDKKEAFVSIKKSSTSMMEIRVAD